MTDHWANQTVFYHIYPLGLCGAPEQNDFNSPPQPRLAKIHAWLDHIQGLGFNGLYLGPVFESSVHGYDTVDYFRTDRRLGTNDDLKNLAGEIKGRGLRLILDGVFNHVGRDFWAFRDVRENGPASRFAGWFHHLKFGTASPYGDPFTYEGWNGHLNLVKLNLKHPEVKGHLFHAVSSWLDDYDLDGLRLDAADAMDLGFLAELAAHCRGLKPDFWLMGEMVHGDYRRLVHAAGLDSVTNYECYKGLYSSHNDSNFFEIAYSLNRQFGSRGLYRDLGLYSFSENHDVNRVASVLREPAHLFTLYMALLTMPGVPSLYYGGEWGLRAKRTPDSDRALRPELDLGEISANPPEPGLAETIKRLIELRRTIPALQTGDYSQLHVAAETFAFARKLDGQEAAVAVNSSRATKTIEVGLSRGTRLIDVLNPGESFPIRNGRARLPLHPRWGRVLLVE
ncbi:MAG: alpha-amylase family glycosyl hydrolase [Pseudomonadota bacterium]